MAFGVTTDGFVRKSLAEVKGEIEAAELADNPELNVQADVLAGQFNSVMSNAIAELWEVLEAVYGSNDPDAAVGQSLDAVSAITGALRLDATPSTVLCDITLEGGFTLPAGSVAFVPGVPSARFLLDADVENASGGPLPFTDVPFTAESVGPIVANSGTLTGGPELVVGWSDCTNPLDADVGTNDEVDSAFRLRREQLVSAAGGSTADAIRADVLQVDDVTSASIINNRTDVVFDGVPAHAFEVIVLGGLDADIAAAIFGTAPAGILPFGSTIEPVIDSEGNSVDIGFTRPTEREIHLEIDVSIDADDFPAGGEDEIKEAVVAAGEFLFLQGNDVVPVQLNPAILEILGVKDITAIRLGFATSPVGEANLTILIRELATFDTSRILVTTSPFVDN